MAMIQLNLLPDIKKEVIKAQRVRARVMLLSILMVLGAVGFLVMSVLTVYVAQPAYISSIRGGIEKGEAKLKERTDSGKYLTLQNQLSALPGLHENKLVTSRLLDILPIMNPSDPNRVSLSSVTLSSGESSMTLSGKLANYEALNVFVDTLKNARLTYVPSDSEVSTAEALFSSVRVQSSALVREDNAQRVTFVAMVQYSPNLFSNKISGYTVSIPQISDSKSVDQTTKNLFEEVEQSQ